MLKTYLLNLMTSIIFFSLTSFSPHSQKIQYHPPLVDNPTAYIGAITGNNHVEVVLGRTGADAGTGCITFEVDISFNGNPVETFTYHMVDTETYRSDVAIGSTSIVVEAEVRDVRIINRDCQ